MDMCVPRQLVTDRQQTQNVFFILPEVNLKTFKPKR